MSEGRIQFRNHDDIRTLFGSRDKNLRRLRDVLHLEVVLRGDELHLLGEAAQVELVAELGTAAATVEQLLSFKPGDFIELDLQKMIQAKVSGVPVFSATYGTNNNRYAIKIDKMLTGSNLTWIGEHAHGRA